MRERDAVIVSAVRTAIGKQGGTLSQSTSSCPWSRSDSGSSRDELE